MVNNNKIPLMHVVFVFRSNNIVILSLSPLKINEKCIAEVSPSLRNDRLIFRYTFRDIEGHEVRQFIGTDNLRL